MVWECPSATTLTKPMPQHQRQPIKEVILRNPLTEAHNTQKKSKGPREEVTTSLTHAIPLTPWRESHTAVTVRRASRRSKVKTQSGHQERKPPLSEAHSIQNTHPRLACTDSSRPAPDPITNIPDQILTQRTHPHILMKHGSDDTDRDMQIESATGQSPVQCKPHTEMENGHPNNHQPDTRATCQSQTQCEQNSEIEIGHPNNLLPDTLTLLRASPVGLNT